MSLFNKTPGETYKSSQIKIRKLKRKLKNIDQHFDPKAEKKTEKLTEKLNRAYDDRYVANSEMKNPPAQHKTYKTTVNVSKKKSAELHIHVGRRKKSK